MVCDIGSDELLRYLSQKRIVIYGTGYVGRKFFYALKKHGLEQNILSFFVSELVEGQNRIEGIPVRNIDVFDNYDHVVVCIAVHEVWKDEIACNLRQMDYIWIYPFLNELLLGRPIEENVHVDLTKVIRNCMKGYRLAVRYMVVEQYFKKNKIGYDIYIKAISLHCDKKTAEERLQKFCEMIYNWERFGYDKSSRISINTQYEIVDGCHRISLARYYGQKKVICNIFSNELSITELHGEKCLLTEEVIKDGGFRAEDIEALDKINKIIRGV